MRKEEERPPVSEKVAIFSPENVQTKVLPIHLKYVPTNRGRSEMYGTVGTKLQSFFVFELHRCKVDKKPLKITRPVQSQWRNL